MKSEIKFSRQKEGKKKKKNHNPVLMTAFVNRELAVSLAANMCSTQAVEDEVCPFSRQRSWEVYEATGRTVADGGGANAHCPQQFPGPVAMQAPPQLHWTE